MAYSGKDFEDNFKTSWAKQLPTCSLLRLYDSVSGYKAIANPCDFVAGTPYGTVYIECKTTKSTSFSFNDLTDRQFEDLLDVSLEKEYTNGGVLVYFRKGEGIVKYYPIEHIAQIKLSGIKSVNPTKHINAGYEIGFIKKRVNIQINCEDLLNAFKLYYGERSEDFWGTERSYLKSIYGKKK